VAGPIVFDAYGTLFDPAALAEPLERRFPGRGAGLAAGWRATQLRHTWLRSLMGPTAWTDFDAVSRDALVQVLRDAGHGSDVADGTDGADAADDLVDVVLATYRTLPPYPDVVAALHALPTDRPRAILTNGRRSTVEATVAAAGLSDVLPIVLSAEDVGVYKPAPEVYALATRCFDVGSGEITFVSGNAWDCAGAAAFGLRVVRVQRSADGEELVGPAPAATIASLAELR
jgi:2-haloacid dehalogenase